MKSHTGEESRDLKASEDAAVWLQRLRTEDTDEVRAEFSAWVREGAKNLEEFLFAQAMWKEMDRIDPAVRERLWPAETPDAVIQFPGSESSLLAPGRMAVLPRPARQTSTRRRFAAVAAAALVCVAGSGYWWLANRNVYVTDVGEQTSVKLADGSMIHLNTNSRVRVNFSDSERAIRLESGEALFTVGKDPRRPFEVLTANARIRALGTQFNVRSSGSATRVTVVDGAVQVSSNKAADVQLRAGDEAQVDPKHIVKAQQPNIERAISWRARRLMFPGDPVGEIAAEFNRYSKTTIRIEGADLQTRRMSGVFDADDPSPLLRFLERDPQIEIVRDADEIVIRRH